MGFMAAASEQHLTEAEQALQAAYTRSWEAAQAALADPEFRAYLEGSLERVKASTAPRISGAEFLASTE